MNHYVARAELDANIAWICQSPQDAGRLELIVARPDVDGRVVHEVGQLSVEHGLVGDNWRARGSKRTEDRSAHPDMQIGIMNARVIQAVAQERERWPRAGDQFYIDLDLSHDNLKPGDHLVMGTAVLEITSMLHTGCRKFSERFGTNALRWVNSQQSRHLRLRGIYARVVRRGYIQTGDIVLVKRR